MMSVLRSENNSWLEAELAKAGTSLLVQQQRLVEERGDKVMADLVQQLQHQVDVLRTENLEARLEILACCAIGLCVEESREAAEGASVSSSRRVWIAVSSKHYSYGRCIEEKMFLALIERIVGSVLPSQGIRARGSKQSRTRQSLRVRQR